MSQECEVSILGLVDKGLRLAAQLCIRKRLNDVSILGLVDKGLRLLLIFDPRSLNGSFNPWFSG